MTQVIYMPTGHSARPSSGGKRSFSSSPVTRSGSGFRYSGPSHSAARPASAGSSHAPSTGGFKGPARSGGFKSGGPSRSGGFKGGSSSFGAKKGGFGAGRRSSSFARNRTGGGGGFGGGSRFSQRIDFSKFVKKAEPAALEKDRKSTRLNSSHADLSRMPSSA